MSANFVAVTIVGLGSYGYLSSDGTTGGTLTPVSGPTASQSIAHNQVSVGSTATAIVAARPGRYSTTIVNHGTTDVFVGGTGVTSATGVLLSGVKGASITIEGSAALSAITASGSQTVSFIENF